MKKLWNSFKIAFSMYSKIPMPYSDWSKENMEYVMMFFPLVGAVEGALLYGFACLFQWLGLEPGQLFRVAVLTVIPLMVTGGIHFDGFLDVSDAMSSWQERERRLEILKDSHAGAFAIIRGLMYMVLYAGAVSMLEARTYLLLIPALTMNRAIVAYTVVTWKKASSKGTVAQFSRAAITRNIQISNVVLMCLTGGIGLWIHPWAGVALILGSAGVLVYYHHMSEKYFGGINGDLSGWYNQVNELVMLLILAAMTAWMGGSIWS